MAMTTSSERDVVMVPKDKVIQLFTCQLCDNLFDDATSIIECLHTFCRKCIYDKITEEKLDCCPICKVHLGSRPLSKLRTDHNLQVLRTKVFGHEAGNHNSLTATPSISSPAKPNEQASSSLEDGKHNSIKDKSSIPSPAKPNEQASSLEAGASKPSSQPTKIGRRTNSRRKSKNPQRAELSLVTDFTKANACEPNFCLPQENAMDLRSPKEPFWQPPSGITLVDKAESSHESKADQLKCSSPEANTQETPDESVSLDGLNGQGQAKTVGKRGRRSRRVGANENNSNTVESDVKPDSLDGLNTQGQAKTVGRRGRRSTRVNVNEKNSKTVESVTNSVSRDGLNGQHQAKTVGRRSTRMNVNEKDSNTVESVDESVSLDGHNSQDQAKTVRRHGRRSRSVTVNEKDSNTLQSAAKSVSFDDLNIQGEANQAEPVVRKRTRISSVRNEIDLNHPPPSPIEFTQTEGQEQGRSVVLALEAPNIDNLNNRKVPAQSTPICFCLLASIHPEGCETLPQISSHYLRVDDDSNRDLPLPFVKKFIAQKLVLASEDEVELTMGGQPLISSLSLHDLVDLWVRTAPGSGRIDSTARSSVMPFIMVLHYARKIHPSSQWRASALPFTTFL